MLLEDTEAEKLSALDGLRRDRGVALLDKGKIPPNLQDLIRQTEGEISAIDEAIGEQTRRGRVAAEQASNEARAGLLATLKAKEVARLAAIDRAQTAGGALKDALRDALSIGAEVGRLCADAGEPVPLQFSGNEMERRLAGWLVTALATVNAKHRFGSMRWTFAPDVAFARDAGKTWHQSETKLGARALDLIFNPEKEIE